MRGLIEGKRVMLVDDSIVRGTTSRKIVRMVREAGATEVHVRISCPPTISPCYYGVDTPTREELIASSNSPEEICKFLGADSLGYISLPAFAKPSVTPKATSVLLVIRESIRPTWCNSKFVKRSNGRSASRHGKASSREPHGR